MYWVKCPHCNKVIEQGGSGRAVKLESPVKACPECGKILIDHDAIEWSVVSPVRRFLFCSYGNGRSLLHFLSMFACGFIEYGFLAMLAAFLVAETIVGIPCYYIVKLYNEDLIQKSHERAATPGYIELLQAVEYKKLDKKYRE